MGATDSIPVPSDGIDTSNFKVVTQWKQTQEINKLKVSPNGSLAVGSVPMVLFVVIIWTTMILLIISITSKVV